MTRRTWILLGLLAASLLLALVSRENGGTGDGTATATASRRSARTAPAPGRRGTEEPVREVVALASLDVGDVAEKYEPGRDPFRFYQPPAPPPPPPPPQVPPPPPRVAPEPAPPPAPVKPQPPPVDVQNLGRFGPEDDPIAVFSNGEEIYNVRTGGVIEGKFRVARIGYESADLGFVGFPDAAPERLPVGARRGR